MEKNYSRMSVNLRMLDPVVTSATVGITPGNQGVTGQLNGYAQGCPSPFRRRMAARYDWSVPGSVLINAPATNLKPDVSPMVLNTQPRRLLRRLGARLPALADRANPPRNVLKSKGRLTNASRRPWLARCGIGDLTGIGIGPSIRTCRHQTVAV